MVSPDKIVIYSTQNCGYCRAAAHYLENVKEVEFDVIDLSGDWAARKALIAETGHRTVPQIFIGETFIGGFDELRALDRDGKLDLLLSQVGK